MSKLAKSLDCFCGLMSMANIMEGWFSQSLFSGHRAFPNPRQMSQLSFTRVGTGYASQTSGVLMLGRYPAHACQDKMASYIGLV